jgi:ABC-type sugar transport system, permease component
MNHYKSVPRTTFLIINYIFLAITSLICILPFIHLLAVSFSGSAAVSGGEVSLWPKDFTLSSYQFALRGGKFLRALLVSLERVALGLLVNVGLMIITAYPMSKTKDKVAGRNIYMTFLVITMLISGGLIPTYIVVSKVGLMDSIWALILPGALPIYSMIILMNFLRGVPAELEEAAFIDGATPFVALAKVILPIMKPALATVSLFCIVGHWNDWFSGMIYIEDPSRYPLQTYLQTLLQNFEEIMRKSNSDYTQLLSMMNARTGRAAQLFLGALPVMVIYPFLQKYFTTGLVVGSVKG